VHFYVCPSGELSQSDRAVLATLNDDLAAAVGRAGGVAFASARRGGPASPAAGCAPLEEVVTALQQYGSATKQAIFVLLDSPTLGNLLRRQPDLVRDLRLRVMNLRLFTRPLHIFENEEASKQNPKTPNVGVYADQEIAPSTLTSLLATVLGRPVRAVPFQNIAEMARCLAQGHYAASYSKCPAQIAWAAIVEQDASLTVEGFEQAYRDNANKRAPKSFVPDGLQLGIHVSGTGPGVEVIVAPPASVPTLRSTVPSFSAGASMAAVPRTDGPVLVEQQARETPRAPAGFLATLWAQLPSVGTPALAASDNVDGVLLRHPYPIVLTNQDPPDTQLRSALSDSYLRVLNNSAIGSPCSAVAERLHRAYLFNAHLDDPDDASKRLSLGSELVLATGGRNLGGLFSRLQISPDLNQWPQNLGAAGAPPPVCPSMPNERFPEDRLFFANANLAFQHRAVEHLRRGNLDGAAACLRKALAESATPNCHKAERSTYSIYYNPYFYFAVQQVTGGRAPR
jgi:hypothetical protein